MISWTLVGVFATSAILLSIFIIWRTCCQKKSSPETTEAEPEYIDNVLPIPVRSQDSAVKTEPEYKNIVPSSSSEQSIELDELDVIYDDMDLIVAVHDNESGNF